MRAHRNLLGVSALVALGVFALCWVGFAAHWAWLNAVDTALLDASHRYAVDRPGWVRAWEVFCTVLGPAAFRIATVVLAVVLLVRRQRRMAVFLIVSVVGSGLITEVAKFLADRPRPATALVEALSTSFPSGHALGLMVSVIALSAAAWPALSAGQRRLLPVLGALLVVAIGAGRVLLNVHNPSDVVAGWALGYAYVVACLLWVPPRRAAESPAAVTAADGTPAAPDTAR